MFSTVPRANGYWNGRGWWWRGGYPYRWGWYRGNPWWWGWGYAGWAWYPWAGWYDYWDDDGYSNLNSSASNYNQQNYPSEMYLPPDAAAGNPQNDATEQQVQQLQGEVSELRSEQAQSSPGPKVTEINTDTVLVFRDGHKEQVQNYAITGKTLWILNAARARKIPLSELNLAATKKDNEDRGIDFVVP